VDCGDFLRDDDGEEDGPLDVNLDLDFEVEAASGWVCAKKLAIVDWLELPAVLPFDLDNP
jgi:hypothetical protein